METPDEWPSEIQESYDPIRILGTGGFASVVLACHKTATATATATAMPNNTAGTVTGTGTVIQKNKVAIKVVGSNQEDSNSLHSAILYAQREIEILKHVHHPNIVRLFHHWIQDENQSCSEKKKTRTQKHSLTAAVLVLEYARGPTVESLLKHGGALSTNFGRIVIAQTIDAIAYLHCHAVLHRDIKPDNIIVTSTGALSSDAFVWDNENDTEDESSIICGGGGQRHRPAPNWEALRSKYKVTLIDFGFARALTPNDVSKPSIETKRNDTELASYHRISNDRAYKDSKGTGDGDGEDDDLSASHHSTRSTRSLSHNMKRVMSTLGNINFAAPEIVNKVRPHFRPRSEHPIESPQQTLQRRTSTTETISNYVADYGLLVDSYSMGHTIRYMMTGVRPGISIEDVISQQQRGVFVKKLFSLCLGKKKSTEKNKKQKRSVRVRRKEDLPGDIHLLIEALTQISEENRISIRKARWTVPWITDVLESQAQAQEQCPPTASPLASQSQSQSLTQTPQINNENVNVNEEQKEETSPSQALEEEAFRSNFYRISYLPFASIPPYEKPFAPESDSNATAATDLWDDGCNIDETISSEEPAETSLMF